MNNKALIVIDLQRDITKNYKTIIERVNEVIDWAVASKIMVVYIKHNDLSDGTRTFKPGTKGEEFVDELHVVSEYIFIKSKCNALSSFEFAAFIQEHSIDEFYVVGADATACVKSTCFNMRKAGYRVHVFSDCVTSYNLKKIEEMLKYYSDKGCGVLPLFSL